MNLLKIKLQFQLNNITNIFENYLRMRKKNYKKQMDINVMDVQSAHKHILSQRNTSLNMFLDFMVFFVIIMNDSIKCHHLEIKKINSNKFKHHKNISKTHT